MDNLDQMSMGHQDHANHMNNHGNMHHQTHPHHNMFKNDTFLSNNNHTADLPIVPRHQMHDDHASHKSHNMNMDMTFHGGFIESILFSWWNVTDLGEFIGSFLAIFVMALLYEGLKYYRKHLLWKTYTGLQYCAVSPPDKGGSNLSAPDETHIQPVPHVLERNVPTMLSTAHAWQTVLHGVQVLVSYMLMLVFMTYNTYLCAAVVLGSASGYFLFGWRESVVVDFTEHCH